MFFTTKKQDTRRSRLPANYPSWPLILAGASLLILLSMIG
jgi:hypothetical protein